MQQKSVKKTVWTQIFKKKTNKSQKNTKNESQEPANFVYKL